MAMKRALYCLMLNINLNWSFKSKINFFVFVDGNITPDFSKINLLNSISNMISLPSHNIDCLIKGDSKSKTIALASIIAKETRDSIMRNYSIEYPEYKFNLHYGYGTSKHYQAILEYGIIPIHRKSFKPISTISSKKKFFIARCSNY